MTDKKKQEEQPENDFQVRSEAFLAGYQELVKKYNVDIAAYPVYMPDEKGGFKTMLQQSTVDTTEQPYRSNFIAEDGEVEQKDK